MTEKIITISTVLFVAIACLIFAYSEKSLRAPENHDWWATYFSDPKSESLNFYIENYSNSDSFHWSVSVGKNKPLLEADEIVRKGEKKSINVKLETLQDKKYAVQISVGEKIKELSKNFNQ